VSDAAFSSGAFSTVLFDVAKVSENLFLTMWIQYLLEHNENEQKIYFATKWLSAINLQRMQNQRRRLKTSKLLAWWLCKSSLQPYLGCSAPQDGMTKWKCFFTRPVAHCFLQGQWRIVFLQKARGVRRCKFRRCVDNIGNAICKLGFKKWATNTLVYLFFWATRAFWHYTNKTASILPR